MNLLSVILKYKTLNWENHVPFAIEIAVISLQTTDRPFVLKDKVIVWNIMKASKWLPFPAELPF